MCWPWQGSGGCGSSLWPQVCVPGWCPAASLLSLRLVDVVEGMRAPGPRAGEKPQPGGLLPRLAAFLPPAQVRGPQPFLGLPPPGPLLLSPSPPLLRSPYSHILQGKTPDSCTARGDEDVRGASAAQRASLCPPTPGACAGHCSRAHLCGECLPQRRQVLS